MNDISLGDCINHCKARNAAYFSHYNDGKDGGTQHFRFYIKHFGFGSYYPDRRWCACKVTNEGAEKKSAGMSSSANTARYGNLAYTSGKLEGC